VLPQLANLERMALSLLFPQWCLGCRKEGEYICNSCRSSLPKIAGPLCPKCGRPQASGILCPDCISWNSSIDGIRSPFRFEGVIREAVHQFKYKNLRALAPTLGAMMADYLQTNPIPGEILVPVPLHPKRWRERGYNQSGLLAKELGKTAGLPVIEDGLMRQKYTPPQAKTLNVVERKKNAIGAFSCHSDLKNKKIIVIDDVSTSGATLDACATVLKTAGADSVWGLTLAREI
jgi:competence protein ComFC